MRWLSRPRADHPSPRPPASPVAAAAYRPSAWRSAPPFSGVVQRMALIAPSEHLTDALPTWRSPTFLEPLGHAVDPAAPHGDVDGIVASSGDASQAAQHHDLVLAPPPRSQHPPSAPRVQRVVAEAPAPTSPLLTAPSVEAPPVERPVVEGQLVDSPIESTAAESPDPAAPAVVSRVIDGPEAGRPPEVQTPESPSEAADVPPVMPVVPLATSESSLSPVQRQREAAPASPTPAQPLAPTVTNTPEVAPPLVQRLDTDRTPRTPPTRLDPPAPDRTAEPPRQASHPVDGAASALPLQRATGTPTTGRRRSFRLGEPVAQRSVGPRSDQSGSAGSGSAPLPRTEPSPVAQPSPTAEVTPTASLGGADWTTEPIRWVSTDLGAIERESPWATPTDDSASLTMPVASAGSPSGSSGVASPSPPLPIQEVTGRPSGLPLPLQRGVVDAQSGSLGAGSSAGGATAAAVRRSEPQTGGDSLSGPTQPDTTIGALKLAPASQRPPSQAGRGDEPVQRIAAVVSPTTAVMAGSTLIGRSIASQDLAGPASLTHVTAQRSTLGVAAVPGPAALGPSWSAAPSTASRTHPTSSLTSQPEPIVLARTVGASTALPGPFPFTESRHRPLDPPPMRPPHSVGSPPLRWLSAPAEGLAPSVPPYQLGAELGVQRQQETISPEMTEPAAAAPAPPEGVPPAATTGMPGSPAGGAPPVDLDELARRLFTPLSARLRTELRIDRERAGVVTDLRR